MRALPILSDSYYHIYNRGSLKQILFYNQADYARFLFLIMYFQSPVILTQTNRYVRNYLETGAYGVKEKCVQDICEDRFVEVLNFCIMPNHFHLSVRSVTDDGISKYMHRVSSAYAAFFNKKYGRSGHVFQGAYKAKFISSDQQLTYLSAYIHHNPHELTEWKNKSHEYPWSIKTAMLIVGELYCLRKGLCSRSVHIRSIKTMLKIQERRKSGKTNYCKFTRTVQSRALDNYRKSVQGSPLDIFL
jgi:REP element-mobilizing transposase RayT